MNAMQKVIQLDFRSRIKTPTLTPSGLQNPTPTQTCGFLRLRDPGLLPEHIGLDVFPLLFCCEKLRI